MTKVKFFAVKEARHGGEVILPIDGRVKVSKRGKLEVTEECAEQIADSPNYIPWEERGDLEEDKSENENNDSAEKDGNENGLKTEKERVDDVRVDLLKLDTDVIKGFCKDAELPKKQWETITNRLKLVKYVIENIELDSLEQVTKDKIAELSED